MVKEKSMENWNIIKNGHSDDDKFYTCKPGSFNSLQEAIFIIELLP